MLYLVAIYVLVIIVAVIASFRFAELAASKGYLATKAKRYPLIIGAATCFLMMFGQTILSFLAGFSSSTGSIILGWSIFVMGFFFVILYRAYHNMKAAPEAGRSVKVDSNKNEPNPE